MNIEIKCLRGRLLAMFYNSGGFRCLFW